MSWFNCFRTHEGGIAAHFFYMEDASLLLENLADQQVKMLRAQEIAEAVKEIRSPAAKRTVGLLNFLKSVLRVLRIW